MEKQNQNRVSFEDFDKSTFNVDEVLDADIKINPSFYIHYALVKAQSALSESNISVGFARYRIMVEHLEVLCKAAKILDEEKYGTAMETFEKKAEITEEKVDAVKSAKLANFKLGLLAKEIFESKTLTSPLSDKK